MILAVLALPLWLSTFVSPIFVSPPAAQAAPYCEPGRQPTFQFGFAALKAALGGVMGEPLECEHGNPENGDTLQQTTTGLAYYRRSTNTPTFTNGSEHWALTPSGLAYWVGPEVDPPTLAAPRPAEPVAAPVEVAMPAASVSCLSMAVLANERGWTGDRFQRPRDGMEFVTLNLWVGNGCDGPRNAFRSDFSIVTADGAVWASTTVREPPFPSRQIPAGGSVDGWITFAVPAGSPVVALRWDPISEPAQSIPL
ncbi:MAG: DUF4352 domain-containing protein [Chloroflexota bacterium]|nr:DUF4352 domain-containing protein [Chloroflexota bacterium]